MRRSRTPSNSAHNNLVSISRIRLHAKRALINPKHIETLSMLLALNRVIEVSQLDVRPTGFIANVIPLPTINSATQSQSQGCRECREMCVTLPTHCIPYIGPLRNRRFLAGLLAEPCAGLQRLCLLVHVLNRLSFPP